MRIIVRGMRRVEMRRDCIRIEYNKGEGELNMKIYEKK